jgi:hypothetical protein
MVLVFGDKRRASGSTSHQPHHGRKNTAIIQAFQNFVSLERISKKVPAASIDLGGRCR